MSRISPDRGHDTMSADSPDQAEGQLRIAKDGASADETPWVRSGPYDRRGRPREDPSIVRVRVSGRSTVAVLRADTAPWLGADCRFNRWVSGRRVAFVADPLGDFVVGKNGNTRTILLPPKFCGPGKYRCATEIISACAANTMALVIDCAEQVAEQVAER